MQLQLEKSLEAQGVSYWNRLSAMERLHFVLSHQGLFLNARLVNPGELLAARSAPESAQEYILSREECPFFSAINLKGQVEPQYDNAKLVATLADALRL